MASLLSCKPLRLACMTRYIDALNSTSLQASGPRALICKYIEMLKSSVRQQSKTPEQVQIVLLCPLAIGAYDCTRVSHGTCLAAES